MNKRIILTVGLPASGKSTWAKGQVEKFPALYKRVNKDDLRAMIDAGGWSKSREQFVLRVRNQIVREALTAGYSIIVDDTNFSPKHKETMETIAKEYPGTVVEVMQFDTPLLECLERDRKRPNPVGDKVILKMWTDFVRKEYPRSAGLPEAIICDIDGTIAKMQGRSPYDETLVSTDQPVREVIEILQMYKRGKIIEVIMMSGRHETCREDTEAWLKQCGVPYDKLYMRPAEDNQKDVIIKQTLFNNHVRGRYNVAFVLDDRDQVVNLWRDLGLRCLQVDFGSF